MATRDFDPQRSAALANTEPLSFTLFGREWACQPALTPDAVDIVEKVRASTDTEDILYAGLMFVGAVVADQQGWQVALRGAVIDADTLLDLITWLAGEYAGRYRPAPDQSDVRAVIDRLGGVVG